MKIVVLDADPAFGSGPARGQRALGEVDCPRLAELGHLVVHLRTEASEVVERAQDADVLLTNKVVLSGEHFQKLPELRLVSVLATGVNVVDLQAARHHGITVCNVPDYSTASTAQHSIALLLELCSRVGEHRAHVRAGGWSGQPAFSYFLGPTMELEGKTMGVVGLGSIGTRVGRIAESLGMQVIAHTRTARDDAPFRLVDKETLLRESDCVSLHCPLTEATHHFIDAPALRAMKKSALLVNGARGPVVDEAALAAALDTGEIAGAATDVLSQEPPSDPHPLLSHPRCVVTPHIAWASVEARRRLLEITARNIEAFRDGTPQNVVAAPALLEK